MILKCTCGNSKKANLKNVSVPEGAIIMRSNYCPKCEEGTGDFYEEWFEDKNYKTII